MTPTSAIPTTAYTQPALEPLVIAYRVTTVSDGSAALKPVTSTSRRRPRRASAAASGTAV
ncbi:hypothetical protein [Streptomyces sp. CB02400]|uniref:hypothetical protein n=1 Tax=unclassified Streptomyces TaxID=2593676 RepID=UPI0011614E76